VPETERLGREIKREIYLPVHGHLFVGPPGPQRADNMLRHEPAGHNNNCNFEGHCPVQGEAKVHPTGAEAEGEVGHLALDQAQVGPQLVIYLYQLLKRYVYAWQKKESEW
jgi:hypothetical protein